MKIGILADTHGYLDPRILDHFTTCDEIWHAGDFGTREVAEQLQACRPLRGVHGNIDDAEIRTLFGRDLEWDCEGLSVWMTHIAGRPGRYDRRVRDRLRADRPKILVSGHSHILQVQRDAKHGGMVFLNPGAAGRQGWHLLRTVLLVQIEDAEVKRVQAVELGGRR